MTDGARIRAGLDALAEVAARTAARSEMIEPIVVAMRHCLANGGTIFLAGNGGSAADAQHIATEYVVRYHPDQRRPLRAVALTTDTSVLTAAGNDFGFQEIFARQLEALARRGDLLVVHSTSGNSVNLVEAVERARPLGVVTVALLGGDGGALASLVDHSFIVPDDRVNHIQEMHLAIQHQITAILTGELTE